MMKNCLSKLMCRKRDPYAEVYSQAYSLSLVEADRHAYLAKQQHVPSSTSFLSHDNSYAIESDGTFSDVMASVDLLQIGNEQDERRDATETTSSTMTLNPLTYMAMKTVTSIEEQDTGELDIEACLDSEGEGDGDGLAEGREEASLSSDEGLVMDPMDYHVVSKYCAKSKRIIAPKAKVSPFMIVKKKLMRTRHFDMMTEDHDPTVDENTLDTESADESIPPADPYIYLETKPILRAVSSVSGLYIEGDSYSLEPREVVRNKSNESDLFDKSGSLSS